MDNKRLIIIVSIVFIGIFLFFLFTGGQNKIYNWTENYRIDNKQPYGAYVFYELMKSHYVDDFEQLESSISRKLPVDAQNAIYIVYGQEAYYQYEDIDTLMAFVKSGNSALFMTVSSLLDVRQAILGEDCGVNKSIFSSDVNMMLEGDTAKYDYEYLMYWMKSNKFWNYMDSIDCESTITPLGYIDSTHVNFVEIPYGDGHFYFHTSPLAFSNYYLKEKGTLKYAEKVLSSIRGDKVYWDEFSKLPRENVESRESPLKYILSQPPLRWAWYILLIGVVIYVIFHAKRRQRIIPVLESNRNTTIEYAETIGYLYYEEQNHKKIADHKMNLFLGYIRNKYHLHTNQIDDALIKKISRKSQVPFEEVDQIFKQYYKLDFKVDISADELISFHEQIEAFYNKCK